MTIEVEHVPGTVNQFRLNLEGRAAIAAARSGFYAGPYSLPMTEPIMIGGAEHAPAFMMRHDNGTIAILADDPEEPGGRLLVAEVPWFGPKRKRGESMFKVPIEADARQHAQVRLFLAAPDAFTALKEVREAIAAVNDAAGLTVFNPAVTEMVAAAIAAIEGS